MNKHLSIIFSSPLFHHIEKNKIANYLQKPGVDFISLPKNVLVNENPLFHQALFLILAGSLDVYKGSGEPKVLVNTLETGNLCGMATLFYQGEERVSQLKTREKTELLLLSRSWFEATMKQEPQLSKNYIAILSERIQFLNGKIDAFTNTYSQDALLSYLSTQPLNENVILLDVTMTKLAKKINVSRASLYRSFSELAARGILERNGQKITILQPQKLHR